MSLTNSTSNPRAAFNQGFVYELAATPNLDAEEGVTSHNIRIVVNLDGRKLMEFVPDDSDALIHHLGESGGREGFDWSANNGEFSFRVTEVGGGFEPARGSSSG